MTARRYLDTGLLPEFSRFKKEAGWDYTLINFIESKASLELSVAFVQLFWPELTLHRGGVFRNLAFTQQGFDAWWQRCDGDIVAIEKAVNMLHVRDIVPSDETQLDDTVLDYLGESIAEMWSRRSAQLFPDRTFMATFDAGGESEEPTVLLYQRS